MLSTKKLQQFKEHLEGRIADFERVLTSAEQETRATQRGKRIPQIKLRLSMKGKRSHTRQMWLAKPLDASVMP